MSSSRRRRPPALRCGLTTARLLGAAVALLLFPPRTADAGYYWGFGTLSSDPSVCFVGSALDAAPEWVAQILDALGEFEQAANLRFEVLGTCPPPIPLPLGGGVWYPGDIRIALFPGSGRSWFEAVPGPDCTIGFVDSSFGREPSFLTSDRGCLYNLKLGNDQDASGRPWRNHVLHEVGHSLGLAHEHQRPDALDASCQPKATACPVATDPPNEPVCMTPYDRDSVMNYQNLACGIDGNYGHSGLSAWDRLTLHILYPEPVRVAEVIGTKVASTAESFSFDSLWALLGARLSAVSNPLDWRIDGASYGSGASLAFSLPAGTHTLALAHQDFLGRSYFYSTTLRSLPPAEAAGARALAAVMVPEPSRGAAGSAALFALAGLAGSRARRSPGGRGEAAATRRSSREGEPCPMRRP